MLAGSPQPVRILGYDGDAMEPFLSRDGAVLFFNSSNAPGEDTAIHWAEFVDPLTFRHRGLVPGANSERALDGTPTLSRAGHFCFISPRAYSETLATVYCGQWSGGQVAETALQPLASPRLPGRLVFDVEIDATGDWLVMVDGRFTGGPLPQSADLRAARRNGPTLALSTRDDPLFSAVNTPALEYAPALSADGLRLAFTRAQRRGSAMTVQIYMASRETDTARFGAPVRLAGLGEFVEGPTFAADDQSLYFHRLEQGRYSVWRVTPP